MNAIGIEGIKSISRALKINTTLKTLNIEFNDIGIIGAKIIADIFEINTTLATIMLGYCNIDDDGIKIIKNALTKNKSITRLVNNISINYNETILFIKHMFDNI